MHSTLGVQLLLHPQLPLHKKLAVTDFSQLASPIQR
jgi:hypothetical protein